MSQRDPDMSILRECSPRSPQSLAAAGLVVLGAGGTALAIVAGSPGPVAVIVGVAGFGAIAAGFVMARKRIAKLAAATRPILAISSALRDFAAGERHPRALGVEASSSPAAESWNSVLDELGRLRDVAAAADSVAACSTPGTSRTDASRVLSTLPFGIVVVDSFGVVSEMNAPAASALGVDASAAVGAAVRDLVAHEEVREGLDRLSAGSSWSLTREFTTDSGAIYSAGIRSLGAAGERGKSEGTLIVLEDVTQRRKADETRGQIASNTAHELRAPLTNIRLYVEEAIDAGTDSPDVTRSSLNVIQTEVRRLERLVDGMLNAAELESGSITINPHETRLEVVFGDLQSDYAPLAKSKGIDLVFDLPPKYPVASVDRERLTQALQNLVGNAIKYSDVGAKVEVRVHAGETELEVEVEDSGLGIAPEEQEQVFERFVRSSDDRVAERVGTGLGLCIAREIARGHGGDITLVSEFGVGSTFTLRIPLAEPVRAAA